MAVFLNRVDQLTQIQHGVKPRERFMKYRSMAAPETSAVALPDCLHLPENPGLFVPNPRRTAAGYDRLRRLETADSIVTGHRSSRHYRNVCRYFDIGP
jgi:hypothetical protein